MIPNPCEGVVTKNPKLFRDGVGLWVSWAFEGAGLGGGYEGWFGGQALIVAL